MYDDLRRRHDDLEREMARRGAEQQMASMYDNLQKKYDALANEMSRNRESPTSPSTYDDLRRRIEELARDVGELKRREYDRPAPASSPAPSTPAPPQAPEVHTMQFLCPFCGGSGTHSHGNYFYPGYSGPPEGTPVATTGTSSRPRRHTETQTPFTPGLTNTYVQHPTTPAAASTPYSPYYHKWVTAEVQFMNIYYDEIIRVDKRTSLLENCSYHNFLSCFVLVWFHRLFIIILTHIPGRQRGHPW